MVRWVTGRLAPGGPSGRASGRSCWSSACGCSRDSTKSRAWSWSSATRSARSSASCCGGNCGFGMATTIRPADLAALMPLPESSTASPCATTCGPEPAGGLGVHVRCRLATGHLLARHRGGEQVADALVLEHGVDHLACRRRGKRDGHHGGGVGDQVTGTRQQRSPPRPHCVDDGADTLGVDVAGGHRVADVLGDVRRPLGSAHAHDCGAVVVAPVCAVAAGAGGPGLAPQVLGVDDHAVEIEDDAADGGIAASTSCAAPRATARAAHRATHRASTLPATSTRTSCSSSSARCSAGVSASTITASKAPNGTSRCSAVRRSLLWSSSR